MFRRHGSEKGNLQHEVHHGAQRDRSEDGKGHAAAGIPRLAGQVYRALETVVAEYDAAGGDSGEDGRGIAHMPSAVNADLEVFPMEPRAHQGDGGGRRHDELEKGNGTVGVGENLHAPEIEQEIHHHQRGGYGEAGQRQLSLTIGGVNVEFMRPGPRPGTHVLHRRLGLDRNHGDNGNPGRPPGDESNQRAM